MKKRLATATLVAGLITSAATVIPSGAAQAVCPEVGQTYYSFSAVSSVWRQTSLRSSYVKGPGSISLTKGREWNVSASMTATVSAEAGIVFAKASTSLGITVGAGYSGSQSYTYTLDVPAGKIRALQKYKSARKFTVTKKRLEGPCTMRTIYTSTVIAPVASDADKYFMYGLVS